MSGYAEVIGDPIAHSLSPLIHNHWLRLLGREKAYRSAAVPAEALPAYFAARRGDPEWCGCNLTMPHKVSAMALVDRVSAGAARMGAVNTVVREGAALVGHNMDSDGVAAALKGTALSRAVVIGGGGAARAAAAWLADQGAAVTLLVRSPQRAEAVRAVAPGRIAVVRLDDAETAIAGAGTVINASPLGQEGAEPMPTAVLAALAGAVAGAVALDMVYRPVRTPLLCAAEAAGMVAVDGLVMLVGQARAAFALLFGGEAPVGDAALRAALVGAARARR